MGSKFTPIRDPHDDGATLPEPPVADDLDLHARFELLRRQAELALTGE